MTVVGEHPERPHCFRPPRASKLSGALRDISVETLGVLGHNVEVSDRYADRFQPAGGPGNFTHRIAEPFDYLDEQRNALLATKTH